MIYDLKLGFSVQSLGFKPCLHVTRHAEDPFSFGRELIRRAAIESNENLVSIAKSFSGFQNLLLFSSSIASRGGSRSNRVCGEVLCAACRYTGIFP